MEKGDAGQMDRVAGYRRSAKPHYSMATAPAAIESSRERDAVPLALYLGIRTRRILWFSVSQMIRRFCASTQMPFG